MDVEKQFLRLFMFSHKVSLPVVRTYFISSVLCHSDYNNDIVTFLEHHKHDLFHRVGDYKCCQCTMLPSLQARCHSYSLANDQFKKLYDVGNSIPGHFIKGSRGRVFQQCFCCITAKKDSNPKTYDLSLLISLINYCVKLTDNTMLWLETIRKCRNRLCHIHDINDLSKCELQTLRGTLECSVLSLAGEVHAQPAYKESIELLVDTFKDVDYSRDTIAPLMEAMKAEINNNVNGVIQHQSEKMVDHMKALSKQSEEQRNFDKKESQSQLLAVSNEISAKVEACHADGKQVIERQTIELKGALEERQQREESRLSAIHKDVEIIKGNMMSHKRDQISFDIQLTNEIYPTKSQDCPIKQTEDTAAVDPKEKCIVELKISTPGSIGEKKEVIKQYFEKAVEMINLAAPFEVKYVRDGSITIGTLLPVEVLKDEEKFKSAICKFLDQMVTHCNIETSTPLVVKVKISILENEQTGTVKCFIEETKQTPMIDKSVQAVPLMVDQIIETGEIYYNTVLMLYRMKIKDSVAIDLLERECTFDLDNEPSHFLRYSDHEDILLIGCCKDIEWIESVLTFCKNLTPICQIEQKQKSESVLNRENIRAIIYVASRSSQQSYDLKWMIECLTQSSHLPHKVFTVVRDKVMTPAIFPVSKQFHVSSEQKEWLPDLIDAFSKIGLILFSLQFKYECARSYIIDHFGRKIQSTLLLGNYTHVAMIDSLLSQYRPCLLDHEINLRKRSSLFLDFNEVKGIICIVSKDFKVESLINADIIHLKQMPTKVVTLMTNERTLPVELKGTKQIDITGNCEDWLPELITAIQKMWSIVWILRCITPHPFHNYVPFSNFTQIETNDKLIVLMGNIRDIQWFNGAFLKSRLFQHTNLIQACSQQLDFYTIKCVLCIITKKFEQNFSLSESITKLRCWPNEVVTLVRETMKIPDVLKETRKVYVTDNDAEWQTYLLNIFRNKGFVDFVKPDERENCENKLLQFRNNPHEKDKYGGNDKKLERRSLKHSLRSETFQRPQGVDEKFKKGCSSTQYEFAANISNTFLQTEGADEEVNTTYSPKKYDSSTLDSRALIRREEQDSVNKNESKTYKRKHDEIDILNE